LFEIEEVNLSGFRGVNTPRSVKFGRGVTLLFGANGSGKSSVLQAIEWSLTSSLPYLSGHDFVREDAIANLFHRKLSTVETVLRDGEQSLTCTRTRRMAKSTTRGSSEFTLEFEKKVLHDAEAQNKIDSLMGFAGEDYSKVVYLHQESVKELLSADPKERSRAVDKLLGT
jgi:DNA repair exonuclease SbcCD ATPase subunit